MLKESAALRSPPEQCALKGRRPEAGMLSSCLHALSWLPAPSTHVPGGMAYMWLAVGPTPPLLYAATSNK